jgi:hypothetical protein
MVVLWKRCLLAPLELTLTHNQVTLHRHEEDEAGGFRRLE